MKLKKFTDAGLKAATAALLEKPCLFYPLRKHEKKAELVRAVEYVIIRYRERKQQPPHLRAFIRARRLEDEFKRFYPSSVRYACVHTFEKNTVKAPAACTKNEIA